jgi:hypothetical protein
MMDSQHQFLLGAKNRQSDGGRCLLEEVVGGF